MELGIQPDYMKILKLDDEECRRRLEFFELTPDDFQRLTSLRAFAERWTQEITEGLYELIMKHPESRSFFPDDATLARVKRLQNAYFLHLFSGTYDLELRSGQAARGFRARKNRDAAKAVPRRIPAVSRPDP